MKARALAMALFFCASGRGLAADASGAAPMDVNAIDPESFRALAVRLSEGQTPKIDGRLDDAAWSTAQPAGSFVQREPALGTPSSERTEFRMLYDERRIYFGIWAYDSEPRLIKASEMKRDSGLRRGDQIKIAIDTLHDKRNAFYFSTNPLGAEKDAVLVEDGRIINYDWNAVWECKTSRDDKGWYVEIAIPLSQLRFKGGLGEATWGLNLCRIIIRKNEDAYWVPYPREWGQQGFARVSRAGLAQGLADLKPRRRLELIPYVAPRRIDGVAEGIGASNDLGYGLDVRTSLTSTLAADLTFKTDFAQVEADQEVVNLSRFSLFFPEKRRFFTESVGIFDYGRPGGTSLIGAASDVTDDGGLLPLFYSRRIGLSDGQEVPILGGGKVTGQIGAYSVGLMNIETDKTTLRAADGGETEAPRANYTVARLKRNIFASSNVGAIFLNRQGGTGASFDRTLGFDTGLNLGRALVVTGLAAKAFRPQGSERGKDVAGAVDARLTTDRYGAAATYLDVGKNFTADMGFIRRRDIRNPAAELFFTPRPNIPGVRQMTMTARGSRVSDHAGTLSTRNLGTSVRIDGQSQWSVQLGVDRDFDRLTEDFTIGAGTIPPGTYQQTTYSASYASDSSRRIYGNASVQSGGYYDGTRRTLTSSLNAVVSGTFLIESVYTRNAVRLPGRPTYNTNTVSARASYSFSPDLFVKGFFQLNDDRRLASLNLLLWYIYRPGSDLYVVYNQGWNTNRLSPFEPLVRDRSLAVKMTFWWSR